MSHLVRAGALTNYLEVATHLGLNPQAELAAVGLSTAMLQDPEYAIPVPAAVELLENSAAHSGCQTFGLRMAESRQLSDLGAVSLLFTHQPTLRDALQMLIQYRHLMNPALAIFVEETGGLAVIREEVVTDTTAPRRQATELALGVMARLCANLLGQHWRPISVNFVHEAPADLRLHRRLFGCDVVFGAEFNGIACPASLFNAPTPNADPAMARFARRYLDSLEPDHAPSLVFEVRKAIYLLLPMGRATVEQIAQSHGMNVRTLQRRLLDSEVTFSDLVGEVRRDLVQRYMQNPGYSMARIAGLLGYSVPSSFTRWFAAEFGTTPAAWRQANGQPYAP
jgi:AraC-like DNA-binding protein